MSAWCKFKIGRVSCATERRVEDVDVAKELLDLQSTGNWDVLSVAPDAVPASDGHWQFPRIGAGWEAAGSGYVVQCFETAESNSFILATAADMSAPEILVELGGLATEQWPRQLFVPYELALRAVRHFLQSGLQDPGLDWIALDGFPRKTVRRRGARKQQ